MLGSLDCSFLVLSLSLLIPRGEETWTRGIVTPQVSERESPQNELAAPLYPYQFAEDHFVSSVRESVKRLSSEHRPLLVHTRVENDTLVLLRQGADNITTTLYTPLYTSLQAVSHLPVSVAAIVAPDIVQAVEKGETTSLSLITLAALNKTLEVLHKVKNVILSDEDNLFSQQQKSRQISILDITEQFVVSLLNSGTVQPSLTLLDEFGDSLSDYLRKNSRDAVSDYLQCLNSTITQLFKSISEDFNHLSVLIELPSFAEPCSFIVQYYERLLNYKFQVDTSDTERIILSPTTVQLSPFSDPSNTSINTLSESTLTHVITRTFYGKSDVYSSTHLFMSEAAEDVICSPDLMLQSCYCSANQQKEEKLPAGFSNRTERVYVSVIIFMGTLCIVLAIVVFCILKEGKVMRNERWKNALENTSSNLVAINRNAEEEAISSDEEQEYDQEELANLETSGFFHQARRRGRGRWRGKYSVNSKERRAASSTTTRERPSVTYSEVSIHQ